MLDLFIFVPFIHACIHTFIHSIHSLTAHFGGDMTSIPSTLSTQSYVCAYSTDTDAELALVRERAIAAGAEDAVVSTHWADGGIPPLSFSHISLHAYMCYYVLLCSAQYEHMLWV